MSLEDTKRQVLRANLELVERGLVLYTWGNASARDPDTGWVVIKPSGVAYESMAEQDMVAVDLQGNIREGVLRPSSDLPTHLCLYRAFDAVGGVVHTHSTWATVWAQAGMDIPCMGTTHADYFHGAIPCTPPLSRHQIRGEYEKETGLALLAVMDSGADPMEIPAGLAGGHGPFTWGRDTGEAVYHAVVLEQVAQMAWAAILLNPQVHAVSKDLLDRHFLRKHGNGAYYGQLTGDNP